MKGLLLNLPNAPKHCRLLPPRCHGSNIHFMKHAMPPSSKLHEGRTVASTFSWAILFSSQLTYLPSAWDPLVHSFLLSKWLFKTINITMSQSALIPFSGSGSPGSFPKCAMPVMTCRLSTSCSLTPAHDAPHQAVNCLWAHQAVSCFYPFSKTFLYLKYTLLLNQHQELVLILQKPPTLKGLSSVQEKLIVSVGPATVLYLHLLYWW